MNPSFHFLYSKNGLKLTEQFEGCRLVAYQDQNGIWTIGYGHTGQEVHQGLTCTQSQAEIWLMQDIQTAVNAVNRLVNVAINQNEFDALVDFCFNVGQGNFAKSTLLKLLNQGNFKEASLEFVKWDMANGKVNAGLFNRRKIETAEFLAVPTLTV